MEDFKGVKDEKVFKDLKKVVNKWFHVPIKFIHSKILDNRKVLLYICNVLGEK